MEDTTVNPNELIEPWLLRKVSVGPLNCEVIILTGLMGLN